MLKHTNIITHLIIALFFISCSSESINQDNKFNMDYKILEEYEPEILPIEGELAESFAEISGLCWYGNKLILLPQYPSRFNSLTGKIFFIDKKEIRNFINGKNIKSLKYSYFKVDIAGLEDLFKLGSGFESVTVHDNNIFFTIEFMDKGTTESVLIKGKIDSLNKQISLDKKSITRTEKDLHLHNISDESILNWNNKIIPIFEVYGKNINIAPKVPVYSTEFDFISFWKFPNLEYRITDVTSVDSSGRFWAMNYFYPGDNNKLIPAKDSIFSQFGIGKSHQKYDPVERLVQLQILDDEIILSPRTPIYLKLMKDESRNWEGIAKLDNIGFIIVTDTFPRTILAFLRVQNL